MALSVGIWYPEEQVCSKLVFIPEINKSLSALFPPVALTASTKAWVKTFKVVKSKSFPDLYSTSFIDSKTKWSSYDLNSSAICFHKVTYFVLTAVPWESQFPETPSWCTFNIQYISALIIQSTTSFTLDIHSEDTLPVSSMKFIQVTGKRTVLNPYFLIVTTISSVGTTFPHIVIWSSGVSIFFHVPKQSKVFPKFQPRPISFTVCIAVFSKVMLIKPIRRINDNFFIFLYDIIFYFLFV